MWIPFVAVAIADPVVPVPTCVPWGLDAFRGACGMPKSTVEASTWLQERVQGHSRLPADLAEVATTPTRPEGGVQVIEGRCLGDEAIVVLEFTESAGPCPWTSWGMVGYRRSAGQWTATGRLDLSGFVEIRCLTAESSARCKVPWDGGIENDYYKGVRCPEGSLHSAFGGRGRCFDLKTCAGVEPLAW